MPEAQRGAPSRPPYDNAAPPTGKPADPAAPGTAIAKRGDARIVAIASRPCRTSEELVETLHQLIATDQVNVVSPVTSIDVIPPFSQVSLRQVKIKTEPAAGEVYVDPRFCKSGEVSLTKIGIGKIAGAAGIQVLQSRRTDDRSKPFYWEYSVLLAVIDFDGTPRQIEASKELDLSDGAPEAMKNEKDDRERKTGRVVPLEDSALADKRRHGAALCETKAYLRGVRMLLGLAHKYRVEDLKRVFIVPKLVPLLDTSDPDVKKAMIEKAVWGERALYGRALGPAAGNKAGVEDALRSNLGVADTGRTCQEHGDYDGERCPDCIADATARERGSEAAVEHVSGAGDEPEGFGEPEGDDMPPPLEDAPRDPMQCTCPCECPVVCSPIEAKKSSERVKAIRCKACYPDHGFDFKRHPDTLDLRLPGRPVTTAEHVRGWNARRPAPKAKTA